MKKIICLICAAALLASGCHHQKTEEKREDVQYAVCRRSMLPKELEEIIEEERVEHKPEQEIVIDSQPQENMEHENDEVVKNEACHFTYSTQDYTYYVIGYGKQKGKGYKIKVKSFQMDEDHVYIDTTLIGITKERQEEGTSYPYLVLKSQYYEKDAVFR